MKYNQEKGSVIQSKEKCLWKRIGKTSKNMTQVSAQSVHQQVQQRSSKDCDPESGERNIGSGIEILQKQIEFTEEVHEGKKPEVLEEKKQSSLSSLEYEKTQQKFLTKTPPIRVEQKTPKSPQKKGSENSSIALSENEVQEDQIIVKQKQSKVVQDQNEQQALIEVCWQRLDSCFQSYENRFSKKFQEKMKYLNLSKNPSPVNYLTLVSPTISLYQDKASCTISSGLSPKSPITPSIDEIDDVVDESSSIVEEIEVIAQNSRSGSSSESRAQTQFQRLENGEVKKSDNRKLENFDFKTQFVEHCPKKHSTLRIAVDQESPLIQADQSSRTNSVQTLQSNESISQRINKLKPNQSGKSSLTVDLMERVGKQSNQQELGIDQVQSSMSLEGLIDLYQNKMIDEGQKQKRSLFYEIKSRCLEQETTIQNLQIELQNQKQEFLGYKRMLQTTNHELNEELDLMCNKLKDSEEKYLQMCSQFAELNQKVRLFETSKMTHGVNQNQEGQIAVECIQNSLVHGKQQNNGRATFQIEIESNPSKIQEVSLFRKKPEENKHEQEVTLKKVFTFGDYPPGMVHKKQSNQSEQEIPSESLLQIMRKKLKEYELIIEELIVKEDHNLRVIKNLKEHETAQSLEMKKSQEALIELQKAHSDQNSQLQRLKSELGLKSEEVEELQEQIFDLTQKCVTVEQQASRKIESYEQAIKTMKTSQQVKAQNRNKESKTKAQRSESKQCMYLINEQIEIETERFRADSYLEQLEIKEKKITALKEEKEKVMIILEQQTEELTAKSQQIERQSIQIKKLNLQLSRKGKEIWAKDFSSQPNPLDFHAFEKLEATLQQKINEVTRKEAVYEEKLKELTRFEIRLEGEKRMINSVKTQLQEQLRERQKFDLNHTFSRRLQKNSVSPGKESPYVKQLLQDSRFKQNRQSFPSNFLSELQHLKQSISANPSNYQESLPRNLNIDRPHATNKNINRAYDSAKFKGASNSDTRSPRISSPNLARNGQFLEKSLKKRQSLSPLLNRKSTFFEDLDESTDCICQSPKLTQRKAIQMLPLSPRSKRTNQCSIVSRKTNKHRKQASFKKQFSSNRDTFRKSRSPHSENSRGCSKHRQEKQLKVKMIEEKMRRLKEEVQQSLL